MEIKDFTAVAALIIAVASIVITIRNSDRYGLKKIVMDKKLEVVLNLYEMLHEHNFSYMALNRKAEFMAVGNFKLSGNMKEFIAQQANMMLLPLYFEIGFYTDFKNQIADLRRSRLLDKSIYEKLDFLYCTNCTMENLYIKEEFCKIFNKNSESNLPSRLVKPDELENLHDFIIKMHSVLNSIEDWIASRSGLKGQLRS